MRRNYEARIADTLKIQPKQVAATLALLDEGNTIPFIARYRKEATHNLDEAQIRHIDEQVGKMRRMDERRDSILASIEEQGKLTDELRNAIENADSMTLLEDLYQPYKRKHRTRASVAREAGLEPLAQAILRQEDATTPEKRAKHFLNESITRVEDALAGARDIVAEIMSDNPDVRGQLREKALKWAKLESIGADVESDKRGVYTLYYDFQQSIPRLRPHQILALNRGESEKILRIKIDIAERDWQDILERFYRGRPHSLWYEQLGLAKEDAAKRLLVPAIERDVRRHLTEQAEQHAIQVFADNLRGLLSQPPLVEQVVLGVDPAYRTGCKLAIVDTSGKVLATDTIYPHAPQKQYQPALEKLKSIIADYNITLIAIGNGTASRETEALIAEVIQDYETVQYLIVNEAGASVYSASELARDELPDMDVSLRGAVSIARRAQDPLAELVKIEPRSIGVGLYQHDLQQTELSQTLHGVVESVVNMVGVDVNTASPALLQYVAGIGQKVAQNIVAQRDSAGRYTTRKALKDVKGLGAKAFEQAAGFLRVRDGDDAFDNTTIHPESYAIAKKVMAKASISLDMEQSKRWQALRDLRQKEDVRTMAEQLGVGVPTLQDILEQLTHPGRDPREDIPAPILRRDVMSMEDLQVGQVLRGTVRNVVDFGAFIDIGVKQDGLLHISQIPRYSELQVGDILEVSILSVDIERGRIGLGWEET
jgi:uncharacterized protein